MPGMVNVRGSKVNERNDVIVVAQSDGDLLISNKIRTEFSRLHEDSWQMSFPAQDNPVLVYRLNRQNRKAMQKGRIYPFLFDTPPSDQDPRVVHRMLPQIVQDAEMGQTKRQRKDDDHKRKMNMICLLVGAIVALGSFLKVWF